MKFIQRMRLHMSAIIGLLTSKQRLCADEISQVLIHESSSFDRSPNSSSNDEEEDGQGAVLDLAKEQSLEYLVRSRNPQDKRFIKLLKVQLA